MYFCYYLSLVKGVAFHLKNLNTLYPRMLCSVEIGLVILRRRVYRQTDKQAIRKAQLSFQLRWARKSTSPHLVKDSCMYIKKQTRITVVPFIPGLQYMHLKTLTRNQVTVPSERIKDPRFLFLPLFSSSGPFCKLEGFFPCMISNSTNHNIYLIIAGVYSI